jgi:hypothetical protein
MPPGRASSTRRAKAALQTGPPQIGLHELHAIDAEAPRRRGAEQQRGAREVGADDDAIRAREVEAHLAGAASDLGDPRVARNRAIEQAREGAPPGARVQRLQVVARRVAGERRVLVEAAHFVGACVVGQPEVGNAVRRIEARAAAAARPVGRERIPARRAGEQIAEVGHRFRRSRK